MKKYFRLRWAGFLTILFPFFLDGCYYDHAETLYHISPVDCTQLAATFSQEIAPLISSRCATTGCHNSAAAGSVVLLTYDQISAKADRIQQRVAMDKTMPPGGGLSAVQLNQIQCWVANGAKNN